MHNSWNRVWSLAPLLRSAFLLQKNLGRARLRDRFDQPVWQLGARGALVGQFESRHQRLSGRLVRRRFEHACAERQIATRAGGSKTAHHKPEDVRLHQWTMPQRSVVEHFYHRITVIRTL